MKNKLIKILKNLKKRTHFIVFAHSAKVLACLALLLLAHVLVAQKMPEPMSPPRLFNDFANVVAPQQGLQIEKMLRDYRDSTTNEVAIIAVPTIGDMDFTDYVTELSLKWKVGQKGRNNGIVLLVSMQEKKMRIATGEGLNGSMPDIICKRILDEYLKPKFKTGDYFGGFVDGFNAIRKAAAGNFKNEKFREGQGSRDPTNAIIVILLIVIAFIIIGRFMRSGMAGASYDARGRRYYNTGGGFGGGWMIGGGGFGGGGGSSGNSDSGMGSFGGFGGGDFDGGGASSDW